MMTKTIEPATAAESQAALAGLKIGDVLTFDGRPKQFKIAKIHERDGRIVVMTAGNESVSGRAKLPGFILSAYRDRPRSIPRFCVSAA